MTAGESLGKGSLAESAQKEHFNWIAELYNAHYNDPFSKEYRERFFYKPMLSGLDLKGKLVLDAMCGAGEIVPFLQRLGAEVVGLDISEACVESFKEAWPGTRAVCGSILETEFKDGTFDAVLVTGGLHHLPPHAKQGISEIWRILKTGGYLCFMEPHSQSIFERCRQAWYRRDPYFEKNEAALNFSELRAYFTNYFEFVRMKYFGDVAYLLVWNSMIFRVPWWLKKCYARMVMALEFLLSPMQTQYTSLAVIGQWKKR